MNLNKSNRMCSICARGGSKGLKNKNLMTIDGNTLIEISIQHALQSNLFDTVSVSSDSDEILKQAELSGAKNLIMRPSNLASDKAAKIPAIRHCIRETQKITGKDYDTFVDLDATSPLRTIKDISDCIKLVEENYAENSFSVSPSHRSPYFNMVEETDSGYVKLCKKLDSTIVRRQDAPTCYDMNASIYVWSRSSIFDGEDILFKKRTKHHIMPLERSWDIDSSIDAEIVEFLYLRNKKRNHG